MRKKLLNKIRSRAGETIAEVLIALLISSVALVMLAGMISATQNMVTKSMTAMKDYYACNNDLEELKKTQENTIEPQNIKITIQQNDEAGELKIEKNMTCLGNKSLGKTVYAYGTP